MSRREYTRRAALQTIGLGAVGTVAASADAAGTARVAQDGRRPDERVQFVEANPEAGFNFPYWLATPETFRPEPVPLLVTMNSARPGQPLTGGGPDEPTTVAERARSQIQSLDQVGAWATEQLGVPQLVPVFPLPDGDPVDRTHRIIQIDRETMLIEGTDLERIDRQLLAMTEHARREQLPEREMHDQLLFWGNSSAGHTGERMAVLHPEEIIAVASSGTGGIFTLPLEEVGGYSLEYPVGVADLETITGNQFNVEAFDRVNKFYIYGAHDTHNPLKFKVPGELPGVWADPEIYETAKAVFGRDVDGDRMPRCHTAFEKADISGQFRIYPEMTHDPELAGTDILEFLRRSIEGEDVSEFGQQLTLPFDRTVDLKTSEATTGDPLDFTVSGQYPPPEGLVTYAWEVDDGRTESGPEATFTFEESRDYDLSLTMETAHGQVAQRGMSLLAGGSSFGAYQYEISPPRTDLLVGQSILIEVDVTNVGSATGDRRLELRIDGERVDSRGAALDPGVSKRIPFSHPFDEPGTYEVSVPPAYRQTISVTAEPTSSTSRTETDQTPTPESSPTERRDTTGTSTGGPGFGAVTALAGVGTALSYFLFKDDSAD